MSTSADLVAFRTAQGEAAVNRLLWDHRSDPHGRCVVCSSGGQTGRSLWPCSLRRAAEAAKRAQAVERRGSAGR